MLRTRESSGYPSQKYRKYQVSIGPLSQDNLPGSPRVGHLRPTTRRTTSLWADPTYPAAPG